MPAGWLAASVCSIRLSCTATPLTANIWNVIDFLLENVWVSAGLMDRSEKSWRSTEILFPDFSIIKMDFLVRGHCRRWLFHFPRIFGHKAYRWCRSVSLSTTACRLNRAPVMRLLLLLLFNMLFMLAFKLHARALTFVFHFRAALYEWMQRGTGTIEHNHFYERRCQCSSCFSSNVLVHLCIVY